VRERNDVRYIHVYVCRVRKWFCACVQESVCKRERESGRQTEMQRKKRERENVYVCEKECVYVREREKERE